MAQGLTVPPGEARPAQADESSDDLRELLEETRILLPGTQVFAGFLVTLPFQQRFSQLSGTQQGLYVAAFFCILVALICFLMPGAYHRIARPVHRKGAFKILASRILVIGLVPFSVGTVLVAYLIPSVILPGRAAMAAALLAAVLILVVWWLFPVLRVHHHVSGRTLEGYEQAG